jgi:hypothetical protein
MLKRFLSLGPTGWLICAVLAAAAFIGLGLLRPTFLGLQFDPFGIDRRKIESLTTERDREASNGIARGLEVEGEREQAERVETVHRQIVEVHTITAAAVSQARSAPDAEDPLADPDADSLLNHQRGLCLARPGVCGAAAPVAADDSGDAL